MYKFIITLSLLVVYKSSFGQNNLIEYENEIKVKLSSLDTEKYIGKPLENFLQSDGANMYVDIMWENEPPGVFFRLILKYSSRIYVLVYLEDLKHQKKFNILNQWQFEKMRKELIQKLEIVFAQ